MDDEIKQNLIKYEAIKQKVFEVFADVKLGDGIGFWESDAIDDYLLPTSEDYLNEKAKDERFDFRKVFDFVEKFKSYPSQIHCFMDAKGLHFYLPVFLLLADDTARQIFGEHLIAEENPKYLELMHLLTLKQKKCIIECIENDVDYDKWVKFYVDQGGQECKKCGKINITETYTYDQAKAEVETHDEYILLQKLKKRFNL